MKQKIKPPRCYKTLISLLVGALAVCGSSMNPAGAQNFLMPWKKTDDLTDPFSEREDFKHPDQHVGRPVDSEQTNVSYREKTDSRGAIRFPASVERPEDSRDNIESRYEPNTRIESRNSSISQTAYEEGGYPSTRPNRDLASHFDDSRQADDRPDRYSEDSYEARRRQGGEQRFREQRFREQRLGEQRFREQRREVPRRSRSEDAIRQPVTPRPTFEQPAPDPKPITRAEVIAKVGDLVILRGDVSPLVAGELRRLAEAGELTEDGLPAVEKELIQKALLVLIERKLILADALRKIPPEGLADVEGRINEKFDSSQVKVLQERTGVRSPAELDDLLRRSGSSLASQKKMYFENAVIEYWKSQVVNPKKIEISHVEIHDYYQRHRGEFEIKAKARWQELMVSVSEYDSRDQARRVIARMGNDIWYKRASFEKVAGVASDGLTADKGGVQPWTTPGELVSKELDRALFELPVGRLSRVIEDKDAFYIVRVIEREEAGYVPFVEAQVSIRKTLRIEKMNTKGQKYLAQLRRNTPIWTIYDNDPSHRAGTMADSSNRIGKGPY